MMIYSLNTWQQDLVDRSKVFKVIPFIGKDNDALSTL